MILNASNSVIHVKKVNLEKTCISAERDLASFKVRKTLNKIQFPNRNRHQPHNI
jgi:hypothetical protein